jgi:hypothetical protein
MRYLVLVCIAAMLAGCTTKVAPATVETECKVFADPGFAVQGKRLKDKQWIGVTQQKGIDVCGWNVPKE